MDNILFIIPKTKVSYLKILKFTHHYKLKIVNRKEKLLA